MVKSKEDKEGDWGISILLIISVIVVLSLLTFLMWKLSVDISEAGVNVENENNMNIKNNSNLNNINFNETIIKETILNGSYICDKDVYNCDDFSGYNQSKIVFYFCRNQTGNDIHKLDLNNDGIPCESLK